MGEIHIINIIIIPFIVSLWILISAISIGYTVLNPLLKKDQINDRTIRFLFASGTGIFLFSLIVLILGMNKLMKPYHLFFVLTPFIIFQLSVNLSKFKNLLPRKNEINIFPLSAKILMLFCIFLPLGRICIFLHFPDVSGDAYLYHITIPNFYYHAGGIIPTRYTFCFNYPLQNEMIYLAGMILKSETGGVLINFWITALILIGLYKAGKLFHSEEAGFTAVILCSLLPVFNAWVTTSHVEISVAFFLLLTLISLKFALEKREWNLFFLTGLFSGLMVTTKLFYLIAFFIFMAVIFIYLFRNNPAKRFFMKEDAALIFYYLFGGFIAYLPWMIKNAFFTSNPFFPFFTKIIYTNEDLLRGVEIIKSTHPFPSSITVSQYIKNFCDVISLLNQTMSFIPIIFFIFIPLILILNYRDKLRWFYILNMFFFMWILHYGLAGQTRWFIPVWTMICLSASITMHNMANKRKLLKNLIKILLPLLLMAAFIYQQILNYSETSFSPLVLFSKTRFEKFLNEQNGYKFVAILDKILPDKRKNILICDSAILSKGRWMKQPFIQEGLEYFRDYENKSYSDEEIFDDFRSLNISYILIPSANNYDYAMSFINNNCESRFEYEGMELFEIKE